MPQRRKQRTNREKYVPHSSVFARDTDPKGGITPVSANDDEPRPNYPFTHGYRQVPMLGSNPFNPENDVLWRVATDRARQLVRTNPFAKRLIEARLNQIVGRSVTISAKEKESPISGEISVQEIIDTFWDNPRTPNPFDLEFDLNVDGTSCYPVFETPLTGELRMTVLPYERLGDLIREKDDVRYICYVVDYNTLQGTLQLWNVVNPNIIRGLPEPSQNVPEDFEGVIKSGNCFLFRINRQQDYLWGWSSLFASASWLEQLNDFVYDLFEYTYWMSSFFWEVTLEGADPSSIEKFLFNQPPPARASIVAHNEKVQWQATAPTFQAGAFQQVASVIVKFLSSVAFGIPPHVLGFPDGSNRATSDSQDTFLVRELAKEQSMVEERIRLMVDYAINCAFTARGIDPKTHDLTYTVNLPVIDLGDLKILTQVLNAVAAFLGTFKSAGYVLDKSVVYNLISTVTARLGIRISDADVNEIIPAEPKEMPTTPLVDPELADAVNPMSGFFDVPVNPLSQFPNTPADTEVEAALQQVIEAISHAKENMVNPSLLRPVR